MPKEATVTTGVTAESVARVRTDQRFDTTWPTARTTNGETTHIANSPSRKRGAPTRWPAYSMNPTEPAAPAPKPITAAVRRRPVIVVTCGGAQPDRSRLAIAASYPAPLRYTIRSKATRDP